MGVFRQPPYPAQLFGAVAVLFGQGAAASPPLTAYSQQNIVETAYRAPDAHRRPTVFPSQLFPQVVRSIPLKTTDPQSVVAAGLRSPTYPQQLALAVVDNLDLYTQESPVGLGDLQTLTALTLRPMPPMPGPLPLPFAALFPAVSSFPYPAPYQPPAYTKPQGNGQPPAVFPSQLFPTVAPSNPPLVGYSPQVNAETAYRTSQGVTPNQPFPSQLFPQIDNPISGLSPQSLVAASYRGPATQNQNQPFPSQLFPVAIPDNPPLSGPEPQELTKTAYRPLDAYRTPPVFPTQIFPPIVNSAPLQATFQQQNAAIAYRAPSYVPLVPVFQVQIFPAAPTPPPVITGFTDVYDSGKKRKPFRSIYSIQEKADQEYRALAKAAKEEVKEEIAEVVKPIPPAVQKAAEAAIEAVPLAEFAEYAPPPVEAQEAAETPAIEAAETPIQPAAFVAAQPLEAIAPPHDESDDLEAIQAILHSLGLA